MGAGDQLGSHRLHHVLAFLAVYNRQILSATVPADSVVRQVAASWKVGLVVGFDLVLALFEWISIRAYTESLTTRDAPAGTAVLSSH